MKIYLIAFFLLVGLSLTAEDDTKSWSDPTSGRNYLLLDGKMTYSKASETCHKKGYAVLDLRYLTEDERKQFLKSELLNSLNYETQFESTPQAASTGTLWQSSESFTLVTGATTSATSLLILNKGGKQYTTVEWRNSETDHANAVCVSIPGFWFRCSIEFRCVQENKISWATSLSDYGNTQTEAVRRVVERAEDPSYTISEAKCGLKTETTRCLRMIPIY